MEPAAERLARAIDAVPVREPTVPLIANVTAEPLREIKRIRALLVRQVTARVRWRETMRTMAGWVPPG